MDPLAAHDAEQNWHHKYSLGRIFIPLIGKLMQLSRGTAYNLYFACNLLNHRVLNLVIDNFSYGEIVRGILELDKSITSATIPRLATGKVLATNYNEEYAALPALTREEFELMTIQSLIRMNSRTMLEHKLGKVQYSSTVYENMITASMYLSNDPRAEGDENTDDDRILMLSFNKNADHELIINSKVLSFLMHVSETTKPKVDEYKHNKKIE